MVICSYNLVKFLIKYSAVSVTFYVLSFRKDLQVITKQIRVIFHV